MNKKSNCNHCKKQEYCPLFPKDNIRECEHYERDNCLFAICKCGYEYYTGLGICPMCKIDKEIE